MSLCMIFSSIIPLQDWFTQVLESDGIKGLDAFKLRGQFWQLLLLRVFHRIWLAHFEVVSLILNTAISDLRTSTYLVMADVITCLHPNHSTMCTFCWWSLIDPLLLKRKKCLTMVLNHSFLPILANRISFYPYPQGILKQRKRDRIERFLE